MEGDRYWHSITDLQPETAYDIKMQSFNEKGESEFGNVVILETKGEVILTQTNLSNVFTSTKNSLSGLFNHFPPRSASAILARSNQHRPAPSEAPEPGPEQKGGLVPRPGDLPYLIVGIVLGAFVFIIVAFIPFCLWRAWAKQSECSSQSLRSLQE